MKISAGRHNGPAREVILRGNRQRKGIRLTPFIYFLAGEAPRVVGHDICTSLNPFLRLGLLRLKNEGLYQLMLADGQHLLLRASILEACVLDQMFADLPDGNKCVKA
jgi:hypothetical protein